MAFFKSRTREKSFLLSVLVMTAKMLFVTILILGITGGGLLMGVAKAWIETAPPLDLSAFDKQAKTSYFLDKNGNKIMDFRSSENRIEASIDEIPVNLINAVIAVEDQRFYTHNGVDVKRIVGALIKNVVSSSSEGGSTITQQLIKQTMLTTDQNYKRKLQEAYMALNLEKQISKEDIILEYLNVIYLGGSNYGVKVAAKDYFGKDVSQLNLRECAMLARIIRDPYKYHPRLNFYTRNTPEVSEQGADHVLGLMVQQGLITEAAYQDAMRQDLSVMQNSFFTDEMYDNAYYVEYAIYDVVTKMLRVEGLDDTTANRSAMETKLRNGGYTIYTTLDPEMQDAVQNVVTNFKGYPATRHKADKTYRQPLGNGEYQEIVEPQAATAVFDYRTGELLAVVGGRSTPTRKKQLNRAYQMKMPVGSSIKPLSVYGPAIDMGNSPGSPVINAPFKIDGWRTAEGVPGFPKNYGGGQYTGVETLRHAMNRSHNTAAAQALYTYVGIENSVIYLQKLGIARKNINETGAGLALGSSGISPVEMAAAFGAIANEGKYLEPYAFTKVLDSDGNVYLNIQSVQIRRQAFKPSTAAMLVDVLKGCVEPGLGTGAKARFGNFTVAGKTGTNSDARGVTFAGMTGYYSCAVWIGHDNYKPLVADATGGDYSAPLWAAIMKKVHELKGITTDRQIISKTPAELGLVKAKACGVSGMMPTQACNRDANGYKVSEDWYLAGTEPTEPCNMHRTIKLCTRSLKSPSKYCSSVKTYGSIYIPEGHPLRASSLKEIREYFKGASSDKNSASVGVCNQCSRGESVEPSGVDPDSLGAYTDRAYQLISAANNIISNGTLNESQISQMQNAISNLQGAVDSQSLSNIKKYGSALQSLVNKAAG